MNFFETNRKLKMALLGAIVAFAAAMADMAQDQIYAILTPFLGFIGFQGLADIGKEKAKVEAGK